MKQASGGTFDRVVRFVAIGTLALAGMDLVVLHLLPTPELHATTGRLLPYRPTNFLSEFVRTDYAPLMTICFFLLALAVLATATSLRRLRREAILMGIAGIALALLGVFPTDIADTVACGLPGRIEPCTFHGRIHNPLSTLVFGPILLCIVCFCWRSRTQSHWRHLSRFAAVCGGLTVSGIVAASLYERHIGWHGFWWTGLMQRSIDFPALLWLAGLLVVTKVEVC